MLARVRRNLEPPIRCDLRDISPILRTARTAVALAFAALLMPGFGSSARGEDCDNDCKLILCLPAGFPDGCGDALDHMVDRLQDGRSSIGFCAMSDGSESSDYDLDHRWLGAESTAAWACPEGMVLPLIDRTPRRVCGRV